MNRDRKIHKEYLKILFIIGVLLIISNCTNKSKGINKLEAIPANAMILASIDNIASLNFSLMEMQQLPNLKSLQFLFENIENHLNGDFLISFHWSKRFSLAY